MATKINLSRVNNVSNDSIVCDVDIEQGRFVTVVGSDPNNRELLRVIDGADYAQGDVMLHASNELVYTTYDHNPLNRGDFYLQAGQPGRAYNFTSGQRVSYPSEAFVGGAPSGGQIVIPVAPGHPRGTDLQPVGSIPTQPGRIYGIVLEATEQDYTIGTMHIVRFARVIG